MLNSRTLCPDAVSLVRLDHTHVLAIFHRYRIHKDPSVKRGLADLASLALEVHASLEEEIFYPAVAARADNVTTRKSVPEHREMREMISLLRNTDPSTDLFDERFMMLMKEVLHHVAAEETDMLLMAERLISPAGLRDLGQGCSKGEWC